MISSPGDDSLAVLVLPGALEGFALEAHARDLLAIPRVIALEPSRVRAPRFLRDAAGLRQAKRLRFPGRPRVLVLYHPAQYPLARALCAHHERLELWYVPPERIAQAAADQDQTGELLEFDALARGHARETLAVLDGTEVQDAPLRLRLRELEVISHRPFLPGRRTRVDTR